ncbi:MAG: zf-HC2 domain-containing protein, partial [Chloroflexia bacterium]|nr:zf-HC2 domain-containing protein [Chloroflexia bacterium]
MGLAHDELRELLGVYALDALLPDERAVVRVHLTGCADCRNEVAALRTAVAALPLLLDEFEPPPALRGRIAAAIHPAPVVANPAAVETWPS